MVGRVTISIEVELGWGYHDIDSEDRYAKISKRREKETKTLERLLQLLDRFNIPISFDVVGHLFLDGCDGNHDGSYPSEWFTEDPGTSAKQDPLFYAPDLIEAIECADTNHEICTHTFSHVLCDEVSDQTLRTELETVQSLHKNRIGGETVSLVTPRHRDISYPVARDCGIEVIRVPTDDLPDGRLSRLYWYLFGTHPVKEPARKDGITETYTSPGMSLTAYYLPTGQTTPHPVFQAIPKRIRQRLHKRYLNAALRDVCEQDSNIHLWTHLHDMTSESQWPAITSFFESLGEAISDDSTRIATMSDLVE